MLEGYTGYSKGILVTGSIKKKEATTYTPGVNNITITKGQYLNGNQVILGDSNLKPENIKSGVSIFGINGTYTSDANAAANQILSGKTAYVKGNKVTGTMVNKSGATVEASTITSDENYNYLTIPQSGYYDTSSKIKINKSISNVGFNYVEIYNRGNILNNSILNISGDASNINIEKDHIHFRSLSVTNLSSCYFSEPFDLSSYNFLVLEQQTALSGYVKTFTLDIGTAQNSNDLLSSNINNYLSKTIIIDISNISKEKLRESYIRITMSVDSGNSRNYDIFKIAALDV